MKKLFYGLGIITLFSITFTNCNKEVLENHTQSVEESETFLFNKSNTEVVKMIKKFEENINDTKRVQLLIFLVNQLH